MVYLADESKRTENQCTDRNRVASEFDEVVVQVEGRQSVSRV